METGRRPFATTSLLRALAIDADPSYLVCNTRSRTWREISQIIVESVVQP